MLDYAHHWTTSGATAKRVILRAFEAVAEEVAAGDSSEEGNESADGGDAEADGE
jgi:hypothetical protein